MTQYMLTVVQPTGGQPPDNLGEIMANVAELNAEMQSAGAWVFAAGLHPPHTATTLRPTENDVLLTDGPFAEGKEHIGGFTIVRADDLDGALAWGRRMAQTIGLPIEVRPIAGDD